MLPWCARWCRPGLGAKQWQVSRREKAAHIRRSSLSVLAAQPVPSAPPLTPGPERVAAVVERAQATVTAGLASRPPLPDPSPHLPPPASPEHLPPAPPAGPRSRLLPGRSTPVVACAPRPPTSWQFVVVCRVLLSCKSQSRPLALSSKEVGWF